MVASNKIIHLLEVRRENFRKFSKLSKNLFLFIQSFTAPWFLLSSPDHYHLVFFLLESCNNLVQYQFDGEKFASIENIFRILFSFSGNANLIYTIIRKRQVFQSLNNFSLEAQSNVKPKTRTEPSLFESTDAEQTTNEGQQPMTTTLADTPCKTFKKQNTNLKSCFHLFQRFTK